MALYRLDDLAYGHLGWCHYEEELRQWKFQRRPCRANVLQRIGNPVKGTATAPRTATRNDRTTGVRKATKRLLEHFPELVPSSSLLPSLATVSKRVLRYESLHEPLASSLVAFGRATACNEERNSLQDHGTKVVAFASGINGESVSFIPSRPHNRQEQRDFPETFNILASEGMTWHGLRSPILQLKFSEYGLLAGSHLAVRYRQAILLLKIKIERRELGGMPRNSTDFSGSSAQLEAAKVLFIENLAAADAQLADVCFSPKSEHELGMIDSKGRWSIFVLNGCCQETCTACLTPLARGVHSLTPSVGLGEADDWRKILWVGDLHTLCIVSRFSIISSAIEKPKLKGIVWSVESDDCPSWILDVKSLPRRHNTSLVLTSRRVVMLQIDWHESGATGRIDALNTTVVFSILHHRNPADPTLRLWTANAPQDEVQEPGSVMPGDTDRSLMCVSAKKSTILTCFYVGKPVEHVSYRLLLDPFDLNVSAPLHLCPIQLPCRIFKQAQAGLLGLIIIPFLHPDKVLNDSRTPGAYYQFLTLHNDYFLTSGIFGLPNESGSAFLEGNIASKLDPEAERTVQESSNIALPERDLFGDHALVRLSDVQRPERVVQSLLEPSGVTKLIRLSWLHEALQRHNGKSLQGEDEPIVWKTAADVHGEGESNSDHAETL